MMSCRRNEIPPGEPIGGRLEIAIFTSPIVWPPLATRFTTLEWVAWFNRQRLPEPVCHVRAAELDEMFYRDQVPAEEAGLKQLNLE
jgi:hypothetical protein